MTKQQIEFMMSLFNKVKELRNIGYDGRKAEVSINESSNGEQYWTIDIVFHCGNSKYTDCIVFREGDDFNGDGMLEEFDSIIDKSEAIAR